MRRLLLLGVGLLPLLMFGVVSDAAASDNEGGGTTFTATLRGANEVPPAGNDLRGHAKVTINLRTNVVCWDLDYRTKQKVTAAHIHVGPAGTAGPVVFGFFNPPASTTVSNDGCRAGSHTLLAAIVSNPKGYYVNVHTLIHPAGAGRGQLKSKGGDSEEADD